jgi:hypothetical protein
MIKRLIRSRQHVQSAWRGFVRIEGTFLGKREDERPDKVHSPDHALRALFCTSGELTRADVRLARSV